jgi:hypothetical protein
VANDNCRCPRAAALLKPRAPFQAVQLVEGAVDCQFNLSCLWREIRKATDRKHTKKGTPPWRSSGCLGTKGPQRAYQLPFWILWRRRGRDESGGRVHVGRRKRKECVPAGPGLLAEREPKLQRPEPYLLRCITLIAGGPIPSALP